MSANEAISTPKKQQQQQHITEKKKPKKKKQIEQTAKVHISYREREDRMQ